jgi:molybdenum cofactor cytidylyltransferase
MRAPAAAAIVLAAGRSERMGVPKALLRLGERTFLECILDAIAQSPIARTAVVVGRHRDEIQRAFPAMTFIHNPDWEQGMTTSFQAGIRALPEDIAGAVLFLADHPLVEPGGIEALLSRLEPGGIVVPVHGGRRGHPVAFSNSVLREILELPADRGANTVVRRDPGRIVEVPMDDPGILCDVDTPEQYAALLSRKERK